MSGAEGLAGGDDEIADAGLGQRRMFGGVDVGYGDSLLYPQTPSQLLDWVTVTVYFTPKHQANSLIAIIVFTAPLDGDTQ
jgi:hypothetical protein